jgi:phosphoribosylformimino-5-aminoimidazole carboxamide ribotide isomerase
MQIYPAIDLRAGKVVRLLQGDYARETAYSLDPVALAKSYCAQGAQWLHVVDLDAAKSGDVAGQPSNLAVIARMVREGGMQVQCGGGVRSKADVQARLDLGCARVVIGSLAVREPQTVIAWKQYFGADKLCLALDCRADEAGIFRVHVSGWQEAAESELFACLQSYADAGFVHALVTDIDCDGTLAGPNVALYAKLAAAQPQVKVQASGGVSKLADLPALRASGASGVIIGKALLEARFSVQEALTC